MLKNGGPLKTLTIFMLFMVIMVGCGTVSSAAGGGTPMVRITVQLVDVVCNHKQNAFWYHDQFYMMTTFAAPRSDPKAHVNTQAQLSLPRDITSGQDLALPQSHLLVFDGMVPPQGSIRGGFTAYNDKQGLTWNEIDRWVATIARSVGNKLLEKSLESGNIQTIAALAVLDLGVNAWYVLAKLNKDNSHQLGEQDNVIPASGPPSEDEVLHFYNSGFLGGINGWDYTVHYHITRTLVTG